MPVIDLGKVVGDPGASMRFRGEWNSGSEYFNNTAYVDTVTHHGSLWVCKKTNTGQEPIEGDNWGIGAYGTETGFDATITIPASGWSGVSSPFAQTVTVSGMTYEKAIVYAVQSDGASPTDEEKAEYAKITGISQNTDSITFYANEKPATDIVIRAFNGAGTEDAADLSVIAAPFDSGKDYVEGEYCMNEGQMWKFDDAKSSGAWDPSKVTSTTVAEELEAHEAAISALNSRIQAGRQDFAVSDNTEHEIQITFPEPFSEPPIVVMSLYRMGYVASTHWEIRSVSSSGFTAMVELGGSINLSGTIFWIAYEP